jgi:hypothetical protein
VRLTLAIALAASMLPLLATAQPSGPLLLLIPSATSLNLTAGEIAPLTFVLQNPREEPAVNVTLNLVASGCAQLLGWNNTWESSLSVNVGDLEPGSVKRVVVPLRCEGGSGSIAATLHGDNTDPAYAVVKVSTKGNGGPQLYVLVPLATVAALVSAYTLRRKKKKEDKTRSKRREKALRKRPVRG